MSALTVELFCPAKVNLALSVGGPDPARGNLHPIASWMTTLRFGDALTLTRLDFGPSRFDIRFDDSPVPAVVDWPLEKDLSVRAHTLLSQTVGQSLPVALALCKRIPPGAGLAGGSSNAAATLVGINQLFNLRIDATNLRQLAMKLGSDVVFLVDAIGGRTSAIVEGVGDSIEPIPMRGPVHLVLIFPPFGCPTGEVYRAFDEGGGLTRAVDARRVRHLAGGEAVNTGDLFNDLAEPACRVRPELERLRQQLANALHAPIHVSGSGSTLFVLARDQADAQIIVRRVKEATGLPALATATC